MITSLALMMAATLPAFFELEILDGSQGHGRCNDVSAADVDRDNGGDLAFVDRRHPVPLRTLRALSFIGAPSRFCARVRAAITMPTAKRRLLP